MKIVRRISRNVSDIGKGNVLIIVRANEFDRLWDCRIGLYAARGMLQIVSVPLRVLFKVVKKLQKLCVDVV